MRIKLFILSLLVSSCSGISRLPSFTPHKIEIRQGNKVTLEMRDKLKIGMPREQVRAILGTPLIQDALHANRWDYVYRLEQDGKLIEQQRMTLYFTDEKLAAIDPAPAVASSTEGSKP